MFLLFICGLLAAYGEASCNYGTLWGPTVAEGTCNYISNGTLSYSYKFDCEPAGSPQYYKIFEGTDCNDSNWVHNVSLPANQSLYNCNVSTDDCTLYHTTFDYFGDNSSAACEEANTAVTYYIVFTDSTDGLCVRGAKYTVGDGESSPAMTVTGRERVNCTGDIEFQISTEAQCRIMDVFGGGYGIASYFASNFDSYDDPSSSESESESQDSEFDIDEPSTTGEQLVTGFNDTLSSDESDDNESDGSNAFAQVYFVPNVLVVMVCFGNMYFAIALDHD